MTGPEWMLVWTLAIALVYLGLSPRFCNPLYRPVLFHPARYPEGNYTIESLNEIARKDVYIDSTAGKPIHGWYFAVPGAQKTILFHHGNAGNLTTRVGIIPLLLAAGASVLIYDYRGFGRSEGVLTIKGICDDGCAAFDYLVEKEGIAPENIINYGESLGTGVACQVSRVRAGGGLILQSGFCALRRIGIESVPWLRIYPSALFPQPDLNNIAVVRQHHPPLMIMHGELDAVIPFAHGKEMFAQASEPKTFVQFATADHTDFYATEPLKYQKAIQEFLSSLTPAAPPEGRATRSV